MLSLCLVSADPALLEMCRGVLDQLGQERCELRTPLNGCAYDKCNIYIWDTETVPKLPAAMTALDGSTKLVIVRKTMLAAVRAKLPHPNFVFLHSPVSKLTLRVFLESAITRFEVGREETDALAQCSQARDKILQKLLETNLKLQEHDTERSRFLTRAVHDIRAPLMAIQGYCALLLAGQFGSVTEEQVQILERMQRSLSRLDGLAAALMDLGMGCKAASKMKLETGSVEASISQAVHEVRPYAQQKQIDLVVEVRPPAAPLLFDSGQLEQVLVNLLENGCKFTPKGGRIRINAYSVQNDGIAGGTPFAGYRLDISDTGPGIDTDRIDRVFDEYASYGGPEDRTGSGLGLAICRMIINAHNGRIWATSGGPGATFSIVLPYPRPYADRRQILKPQPQLHAMRAAV